MAAIPDKTLVKIPVKDNGEKLINLKAACPAIKTKGICRLRKGAAKRLCMAQKNLPKNHFFFVREGYRSLRCQKKMYFALYKKLKKKHPHWPEEKIKKGTDKFVAPVEIIPPHSTGGAIDLTIAGPNGKADMGTEILAFNEKSRTFSKNISKKAAANRKILIKAMSGAGFVNYPPEWWHWSFGDRYWAAVKKKKFSVYGTIRIH